MSAPRNARINAGFSIDQAAKQLGISGGYLSQIERNERNVDRHRAMQIAALYHCQIDDIFLPDRYASRKEKAIQRYRLTSNHCQTTHHHQCRTDSQEG